MKNIKITSKLIVGFGSVLAFILVVGMSGISGMKEIIPQVQTLYNDRIEPSIQMGLLTQHWLQIRAWTLAHILETDPAKLKIYEEEIQKHFKAADSVQKAYEATYLVTEEKDILREFKQYKEAYMKIWPQIIAESRANRNESAFALSNTARTSLLGVIKSAEKLMIIQEKIGKSVVEESLQHSQVVVKNVWIIIGIGLCISIILAFYISKIISTPIKKLQKAAESVTNGNLDVQVYNDSKDEIGKLAAAFNIMVAQNQRILQNLQHKEEELRGSVSELLAAMQEFSEGDCTVSIEQESSDEAINQLFVGFNETVQKINSVLTEVSRVTEVTSSSASELNSTAEEMMKVGQEQAQKTTEVSSVMDELVNTIRHNSQSTTVTTKIVYENSQNAQDSGVIMKKTLEKMRIIAEVVQTSSKTIQRLGETSENIGQIVMTIEEIADQTNLLALNAAIEAARAGEQGRGFAVVADEVRKLAERTSIATKQISETIRSIQSETHQAVVDMTRGSKEVKEGIVLADEAGVALTTIFEGTKKVEDMISSIASATEEQASASEQINGNIANMVAATEQTSHALSEIVTTVSNLSEMTANLSRLIGRFHLGGNIGVQVPIYSKVAASKPVTSLKSASSKGYLK